MRLEKFFHHIFEQVGMDVRYCSVILHHKLISWLWKTQLFYHASFGPVMIDYLATQRDALATQVVILIDTYIHITFLPQYWGWGGKVIKIEIAQDIYYKKQTQIYAISTYDKFFEDKMID